jgi:CoA:oxalate CoA-transferase
VLAELGLDWPALQQLNSRLILCSVTALGYGGPLSELPGYDTIGAAYSGIAHVSGPVGGPPMMPGAAIGDTTTGVHGFAGVAAALFNRERTGTGDWVQVSLLDTYLGCHEINIQAYSGSDGHVVPGPTGNSHPTVCPAGIFPCGTGSVFIACVSPGDWPRLAAAMGRAELGDDPRYATNEERVARRGEVIDMLQTWLDDCGTVDGAVVALQAEGVACAPILTVPEAISHPHNIVRRAVRTVSDPKWGQITIPGMPIRFASVPNERELTAPELGADNDAVLRRVLGLDAAALADLRARGALCDPADHEPPT